MRLCRNSLVPCNLQNAFRAKTMANLSILFARNKRVVHMRFSDLPDNLNKEIESRLHLRLPSNIDARIKSRRIGRLPLQGKVVQRLTHLWQARLNRAYLVPAGPSRNGNYILWDVRIHLSLSRRRIHRFTLDGSFWYKEGGWAVPLWMPNAGELSVAFPFCIGLPPDYLTGVIYFKLLHTLAASHKQSSFALEFTCREVYVKLLHKPC
jgi:hypothetical protein